MEAFKNPERHTVPSLEETLVNIDKFKELQKEEDALQKEIDILEKKQTAINKKKNQVGENILVYDVQIRFFDEYKCFSSLDEAVSFKQNLVVAGIKESDIKIVLTNNWDNINYIDDHKNQVEALEYDPAKLYLTYRQYKKSEYKRWYGSDDK